ncbi:PIG-L family deacetylase [Sinomonas sp. ASV322]|uniref:PIG-L family deacetylase n=1 Tax=Sinomonas sp. ASV322 TaxID=3041920 RepID=UPI0027DB42D2|nr:PIG-L family deacetylase [Sinomonas sp. ASV322]MDQ4503283.1 PIG-L family deacetylase [Sinomonas sp. ASV322]
MLPLSSYERILVLSPHFDDAVLSCWSVIQDFGEAVDVVTMCGGAPDDGLSDWDDTCGFSSGGEAAAARRNEEARALAGRVGSFRCLPILEAAYSGGEGSGERRAILRDCLTGWVEAHADRSRLLVLLPAGAGLNAADPAAAPGKPKGRGGDGLAWARSLKHRLYLRRTASLRATGLLSHSDHRAARNLALDVLWGSGRADVALYEELPYLWSQPADRAVLAVSRRLGAEALAAERPVDTARKAEALASYASQLGPLDPAGRLIGPAHLPARERFWLLTRASSRGG